MIGTWMEEIKSILRTELSSLEDFLLPPAGDVEIAQVEQAMNISFPDELKQLYHTHNGESRNGPGLFFGLQFLSLDEMLSEWRIWSDLQEEYADMGDHYSIPSGWVKEQYINRNWIPFCHDGGGNHLGIDLDPDEHGVVGQVINFGRDEETKFVIARHLGEFIHFMRDTLREGNYTVEQEEGMGYWMYGRNDQARLLRDAQQYALGMETGTKGDTLSANERIAWATQLPEDWQERIRRDYGSAESFIERYQIYLPNENLSDIAPLSVCTQLRELSLSHNDIHDIAPLEQCRELKKLYLFHNPLQDLSPLSQLPYLRQLNVSHTEVTSLEPLAELKHLVELECEHIPAHDYRPLLKINTLEHLSISALNGEQANIIGQINNLKQLTVMDAQAWGASEWNFIGKLPLVSLTIAGWSGSDMEYLRHFKYLKNITLANIAVQDISVLASLPSLQKLKLKGDHVIGNLESIGESSTLSSFTGNEVQVELLRNRFKQPVTFSIEYDIRDHS